MLTHNYLVPEQMDIKENLSHSVSAETVEDAEDWFVTIKERMLDVNKWQEYSSGMSANFTLTDAHGKVLKRHAHRGDYVRIDSPWNGYDWVRIEAIIYDDYPDEDRETIAMHLHPIPDSIANVHHETTHLFDNIATSAIVVAREHSILTCQYIGCDETANTAQQQEDTEDISSDLQWAALVKGLLEG